MLKSIGFKIFLREDIWTKLVFDNKSHFNGRDIILQWTRKDFLKLALRQALQSTEFNDLVSRLSPVGNIDQADEGHYNYSGVAGEKQTQNPSTYPGGFMID